MLQNFFFMGPEQRALLEKWCRRAKGETEKQREYFGHIKESLKNVDYYFWIAEIEPSMGEDGRLYYQKGSPVCRNLAPIEWRLKALKFSPEHGSRIAMWKDLYVWYGYRIAAGYWTLEDVAEKRLTLDNDSHVCQLSGFQEIGGFADGVNNTFKLASIYPRKQVLCGGQFNREKGRHEFTCAMDACVVRPHKKLEFASASIVLTK